ncbi:MAG: YqgE/AlgH family protein [Pseudomonadota bacterium]
MSGIATVDTLQNHFLVAMPSLADSYFERSVTLIIEHNDEGAMGLVINQPSQMTFRELVMQADEEAIIVDDKSEKLVNMGGPVHQDRGFVLHSSQPGWSSSVELSSEIMLTTSKDILSHLASDTGPQKTLVALGYAGWSPGQLEQEIQENSWLTLPFDMEILFDVPIQEKWQAAMSKLGVAVWQISAQGGHA